MMRVLVLSALAACGFPAAGGDDGDDGGDDMPAPDAPVDAALVDAAVDATPPVDADLDLDDDTVVDAVDNCVAIPNLLQHDHDSDGRGDECDLCPHLAAPVDPDTDLDGIGDACDPRDGTDARVAFYGFYDPAEITGWTGLAMDQFAVIDGVLRRATSIGSADLSPPGTLTDGYAATSVAVTGVNPTSGTRWVGVSTGATTGGQYYVCEGYHAAGTSSALYYAQWGGGPTTTNQIMGLGQTIAAGTTLGLTVWTTAAGGNCIVEAPTAIPLGTTSIGPRTGTVGVFVDDYSADWDYLFVVDVGG